MKSYKILYQEDQHKNFSDYFKKENIDYIEGKINGSFAIQYNPQKLNSLLNECQHRFKIVRNHRFKNVLFHRFKCCFVCCSV